MAQTWLTRRSVAWGLAGLCLLAVLLWLWPGVRRDPGDPVAAAAETFNRTMSDASGDGTASTREDAAAPDSASNAAAAPSADPAMTEPAAPTAQVVDDAPSASPDAGPGAEPDQAGAIDPDPPGDPVEPAMATGTTPEPPSGDLAAPGTDMGDPAAAAVETVAAPAEQGQADPTPPGDASVAVAPDDGSTGSGDPADRADDGAPEDGDSGIAPAATVDTARFEPDGSTVIAGRAAPGTLVEFVIGTTLLGSAMSDAAGGYVTFLDVPPSSDLREIVIRQAGSDATTSLIVPPTDPAATGAHIAMADPAMTMPGAAEGAVSDAAPVEPASVTSEDEPGAAVVATGDEATTEAAMDTASDDASPEATAAPAGTDDDPAPGDDATRTETADDANGDGSDAATATVANGDGQPAMTDGSGDESGTQTAANPEPATTATEVVEPTAAPALPTTPDPVPPEPGTLPAVSQPPVLLSDAEGISVAQPALAPGAEPEVLRRVALDIIGYGPAGELELAGRATDGGAVRVYMDNGLVGEAPITEGSAWELTLPAVSAGLYDLRVDQIDASGAVLSRIEMPFVHAALPDGAAGPGVRVVQPGNTLWAIARDRYGEPLKYVQVFEANRDRIRNPDLIYPGQVFVLPEL